MKCHSNRFSSSGSACKSADGAVDSSEASFTVYHVRRKESRATTATAGRLLTYTFDSRILGVELSTCRHGRLDCPTK